MLETKKLHCGSYYQFESLAGGRSCYFESDEEVELFRRLWRRYMGSYIETHKMYLSSEGYQVLMRIRKDRIIKDNYIKRCMRSKKELNAKFLEEPWRIISEQMRIFHSTYVKCVNKIRSREGVLVKSSYRRYYFETKEEFEIYECVMKEGKEIESQRNRKYGVSREWVNGVNWLMIRGVEWVESFAGRGFTNNVVSKLIKTTLITHSSPP